MPWLVRKRLTRSERLPIITITMTTHLMGAHAWDKARHWTQEWDRELQRHFEDAVSAPSRRRDRRVL